MSAMSKLTTCTLVKMKYFNPNVIKLVKTGGNFVVLLFNVKKKPKKMRQFKSEFSGSLIPSFLKYPLNFQNGNVIQIGNLLKC